MCVHTECLLYVRLILMSANFCRHLYAQKYSNRLRQLKYYWIRSTIIIRELSAQRLPATLWRASYKFAPRLYSWTVTLTDSDILLHLKMLSQPTSSLSLLCLLLLATCCSDPASAQLPPFLPPPIFPPGGGGVCTPATAPPPELRPLDNDGGGNLPNYPACDIIVYNHSMAN